MAAGQYVDYPIRGYSPSSPATLPAAASPAQFDLTEITVRTIRLVILPGKVGASLRGQQHYQSRGILERRRFCPEALAVMTRARPPDARWLGRAASTHGAQPALLHSSTT